MYVSGTTAKVVNCIIAGNRCDWQTNDYNADYGPVAAQDYLDHCIIGGTAAEQIAPSGLWAGLKDPANGDYTLADNTDGLGTGNAAFDFATTTDMSGNPRVHGGVVDIGCYARTDSAPACAVGCDRRMALVGRTVTLTANLLNGAAEDACDWTVTAPDGTEEQLSGSPVELTFSQVGAYTVRLAVGTLTATRADFVSAPLTNYVAAAATTAAYPYDTPEKATASLVDAVAAATDGSTIMVTGTVKAANVKLNRGISVIGYGQAETTVDGEAKNRVFSINSAKARVENLTITNGKLTGPNYLTGAGVCIGFRGGTVAKCCIRGCQKTQGPTYQSGGGAALFATNALLTHCIISGNYSYNGAGGGVDLYNGIVDNCLICNNTAQKKTQKGAHGGGIWIDTANGKVRNCTIAANTSTDENAGGIYFSSKPAEGQVVNCLIVENVANNQTFELGKPDWAMALPSKEKDYPAYFAAASNCFVNCAFEACDAIGEGSVKVSAPFVDAANKDYHVLGSAASVEAGTVYEGMSETDLDGMPRVSGSAPDIGCYEVDKSTFAPTFDVAPTVVMSGSTVSLTPDIEGAPEGVTLGCRWTFTNGAGYSFVTEGAALEQVFDHGGRYTIKLEVLDSGKGTKIAEYIREDVLLVAVPVAYVTSKVNEASPAEPFDTPETASTNLTEMLSRYVIGGCRIVLDEGVHRISKTINLNDDIRISGAGADKTFVKCGPSFSNSTRTFWLNNPDAVIEHMTFCGASGRSGEYNMLGPVCYIGGEGGTVRHCVISNNTVGTLYTHGIGIAMASSKGRLSHCLIANNSTTPHHNTGSYGAVAVSAGLMDNCVVRNNKVDGPAGIYATGSARIYNCTVTSNVSTNYDNSSQSPKTTGPISSANGISVSDPTAGKLIVRNCIFAGNVGKDGSYAPEAGGVTEGSAFVQNCLFKFADPAVSVGTKCVNGDPMFVDAAAHDYHVRGRSPAKKKGKIESWMRDDACFETDFGGDPRLVQPYHMDMGAYETDPIGFKLLVR